MFYRIGADLVLLVHIAVVIFALLGAGGVFKWRWVAMLHLPVMLWVAVMMLTGGLGPLALLEHALRLRAGPAVEKMGWVEQILTPFFYPTPLTRNFQILLGAVILLVNGVVYSWTYGFRERWCRFKTRYKR